MYLIDFYENEKGDSNIFNFLEELRKKAGKNKDARIQYGQIVRDINLLQINGTNLPIEFVKHIDGDIWELRPGANRIFFFYYAQNTYVLLHHYRKKGNKTPKREIENAKKEMHDYITRKEKQK